ncbi:MAG: hypothetical protein L0338_16265, partial [Acidobacteria bacterium]|nr:hypothetical protein [Acidobacteriota bacterium]
MGLPAAKIEEPTHRPPGCVARDPALLEREKRQPCKAATLRVVTDKRRPTAVGVLRPKQEVDCPVARWIPVGKQGQQRKASRFKSCLEGDLSEWPPPRFQLAV